VRWPCGGSSSPSQRPICRTWTTRPAWPTSKLARSAERVRSRSACSSRVQPSILLAQLGPEAVRTQDAKGEGVSRQDHWERIYTNRRPDEVSWYQPRAAMSLDLITSAVPDRAVPILDVGGGASLLVDDLLAAGYRRITVLDIAASALRAVQARLGDQARNVSFLQGDVTAVELVPGSVGLWHDRAVFHFLTELEDRRRYVSQVRRAVAPNGLVLVATFAADGPTRCSGLDVSRYSPEELHAAFGRDFQLIDTRREEHRTPSGAIQAFTYCLCRFRALPGVPSPA